MVFISKLLQYPSCACVRNILKIVMFVTGKVKLVYFNLFLDASPPPPDPRCRLDNDMSLYTYTTNVKGVFGLGGKGVVHVEAKADIKRLTKIDCFAKWSFLLYINCIKIYTLS